MLDSKAELVSDCIERRAKELIPSCEYMGSAELGMLDMDWREEEATLFVLEDVK